MWRRERKGRERQTGDESELKRSPTHSPVSLAFSQSVAFSGSQSFSVYTSPMCSEAGSQFGPTEAKDPATEMAVTAKRLSGRELRSQNKLVKKSDIQGTAAACSSKFVVPLTAGSL